MSKRHRGSHWLAAAAVIGLVGVLSPTNADASFRVPPGIPVLLSPPNGWSSTGNPVLEWAPVPNALKYSVEVTSAAPVPYLDCGGETFALRMVCNDLPPGSYTWRVRSIGIENHLGDPSASRTFTKVSAPFASPTLLSPASGSTFTYPDELVLLSWAPVDRAAHYRVEYSTAPGFSPDDVFAADPHVVTESVVLGSQLLGRTIYWRVRAEADYEAFVGPWSAVRSLRVDWPAVPALDAPADDATVTAPTLTWQPLAGARGYEVQADDDPSFGSPERTDQVVKPVVRWDAAYSPPAFYWRVRAQAFDYAYGDWSAARHVAISADGEAAPDPGPLALVAPQLLGPTEGASNVDVALNPLRWMPVDGTIGYDVQIIPADQAWFEYGVGQPTFRGGPVIPSVDRGVTYKWRVRANATNGLAEIGPWSAERTFSTVARSSITMTSPTSGLSRGQQDLLFTWQGRPDAPIAYVELASTAAFDDPIRMRATGASAATARNRLPLGTWFWRVSAGRDDVRAMSETRTIQIVDNTPPIGSVGYPYDMTASATLTLEGPAEDAFGSVARTAVSADGISWTEYDYGEQPSWSLVSDEHGGPGFGPRRIFMRWRDDAGNWSAPLESVFCYVDWLDAQMCDVTPPTVSMGAHRFVSGSVVSGGKVPLRLSVAGSDTGTGLSAYELAQSTDGGAWTTMSTSVAGTSYDRPLAAQHSYQFRVRGVDVAGNQSGWATGPTTSISRFSENNARVTFGGRWSTVRSPVFWLGAAKKSSQAGAKASITFTGRSIAWVGRKGPNRGKATIYVNGTKVATVDLYASTYQNQRVVWAGSWSTSASRKVTIRVAGTSGRPRVDFDAFLTAN